MTNLQAIDLLKGLEQSLDDYCELNDEGKTAFRMAITALEVFGLSEQLPSAQPEVLACGEGELIAQPEIVRCKDCKYWNDEFAKDKSTCWLPCMSMTTHREWHCGSAERRTDDGE